MKIEKDQLISFLNSRKSITKISKHFKCSRQAIYKFLNKYNIDYKDNNKDIIINGENIKLIVSIRKAKCSCCHGLKKLQLVYDQKIDAYRIKCNICIKHIGE